MELLEKITKWRGGGVEEKKFSLKPPSSHFSTSFSHKALLGGQNATLVAHYYRNRSLLCPKTWNYLFSLGNFCVGCVSWKAHMLDPQKSICLHYSISDDMHFCIWAYIYSYRDRQMCVCVFYNRTRTHNTYQFLSISCFLSFFMLGWKRIGYFLKVGLRKPLFIQRWLW